MRRRSSAHALIKARWLGDLLLMTMDNDKKTLEETIVDMTTSGKHLERDRSSREHEVRNLEERAKVRNS